MDSIVVKYKPKSNYPQNIICDIFQDISQIDYLNFDSNLIKCADSIGIPLRHINVLKMIYQDGATYAEIGEKYGVTKEAIRCLKERTLDKIRKTENRKFFEAKTDTCISNNDIIPLEDRIFDEEIGRIGFDYSIVKKLDKIGIKKVKELAVMDRADIRKLDGIGSTGAVKIESVLQKINIARPSKEVKKALDDIMHRYKLSSIGLMSTLKYFEKEEKSENV